MALTALRTAIPRQLEITKQFHSQDVSGSDLQSMKDRLIGADLEVDLRSILGKAIEQLDFAEVTWERFQQFVQRISEPYDSLAERTAGLAQLGAPIEKADVSVQLRLAAR